MKNLLIVPTRNRPKSVKEFYDCFIENSSKHTTLCFAIDNDDESEYDFEYISDVIWEINDRIGMCGTLNYVAYKYCNDYDFISFMGDDHRIRTMSWDTELMNDAPRNLVAYGNDLLQGAGLPTAVLLDANIVRTLGYMAPPTLKHMYLDNFWKKLGTRLGTLRYRDDIVIEHMHFTINKSEIDDLYKETNQSKLITEDRINYDDYCNFVLNSDLEKLR